MSVPEEMSAVEMHSVESNTLLNTTACQNKADRIETRDFKCEYWKNAVIEGLWTDIKQTFESDTLSNTKVCRANDDRGEIN